MTSRYLTAARLRGLEEALAGRDYAVLACVAELRFVTGGQLARRCFAGPAHPAGDARAARRALLRLVQLDVLARLPRSVGGVRAGSAGFVYHLGPVGQRLATDRGWIAGRRFRRSHTPGLLFVRHTLLVAELHTQLHEAARARAFDLIELASEPACWRSVPGGSPPLKPDSYLRIGLGDFEFVYFVEVDRGTEGSRAIERQLRLYTSYFRSGVEQAKRGVFPRVLWLSTSPRRVSVLAGLLGGLAEEDRELFAVVPFDAGVSFVAGDGSDPRE